MPPGERTSIEWHDAPRISITRGGAPAGGVVQRLATDDEILKHDAVAQANARRAEIARAPIIEQRDGSKFSRATTEAVSSGHSGSPDAMKLLLSLWDHAPVLPVGDGLNGLQAVAFMVGCDDALLGRLVQRIEFNSANGGRYPLDLKLVAKALQHEVSHKLCRCEARQAKLPEACDCLDEAFYLLSDALRRGKISDTRSGNRDPINFTNAWTRCYSRTQIQNLLESRKAAAARPS